MNLNLNFHSRYFHTCEVLTEDNQAQHMKNAEQFQSKNHNEQSKLHLNTLFGLFY